ncbi:MAG TPA: sigma 54-interacting transcriptional regulator [Pyrinomonadaceae bacterium]|jgi:DNA-binding NtrC family response regulator
MSSGVIPRILIIDDLFGRTHRDRRNEERANLCGQYLIEDVTGDEVGKGPSQKIKNPIAHAVFYRGQSPICSAVGDTVENDLEATLRVIRDGWFVTGDDLCWAMVLLDLCFYTGRVTVESNGKALGMPEGRAGDDDPGRYFGLRILQAIQEEMPDLPVSILSSKPREEVSREFSHRGARAFIPRDQGRPDTLKDYLWRHGLIPDSQGVMVGRSKSLLLALRDARQIADSKQQVLIRGEAGTGKELLARYIHNVSPRAQNAFEIVSLPAIPSTLVEDTLFGHVRGAFDGAQGENATRQGAFEKADKGTLFLDEVGDTPPEVQPKLLRAIQEGEVQRLGSDRTVTVDVRILSATNVDIEGKVAAGEGFRRDLLDRLRAGRTILLPPLRYRKEDIKLLANKFVREAEGEVPKALKREIDPDALEKLCGYDWPGNVRELRSVIFEAVTRYPDVEHLVAVHVLIPKTSAPTPTPDAPAENASIIDKSRHKPGSLDGLIETLEAFDFDPAKPDQLVGKLPQIEGAFARLLARYLRAALLANVKNRTPENPRGKIHIQPTIIMMRGYKVDTSKAADIIKQLLGISEQAIEPLLKDTEDSTLKEALDIALRLRPKKKDKSNGKGHAEDGSPQ